jgi:hypothetical protein
MGVTSSDRVRRSPHRMQGVERKADIDLIATLLAGAQGVVCI